MLNKTKIKFRQNSYNTSDSGIMFLLALVVPQFLMILVMLICSSVTGLPFSSADTEVATFESTYPTVYTILCGIIPQISMIASFIFLTEFKKVNYAKANQIRFKNFNWLVLIIVIAIGVVCLLGFTPFVNWFDYLMQGWGYKSSVSNIDVSTIGNLIGAIFYIGLLPAICEELVFRGVITNGLKEKGIKTAVIFSAILFALMHQNLQQFIYQLFLGGVMAYIVLKTGNILYTMLLHFFNNFVVLLDNHLSSINKVTTSTDLSNYYSNVWNNIWPILLVVLTVGVVIGLLFLLNFVIKKQKNKKVSLTNEQTNISTIDEKTNKNLQKSKNNLDNLNDTEKQNNNVTPFKNPFFAIAFVFGVIFWIFSVVSSFLS